MSRMVENGCRGSNHLWSKLLDADTQLLTPSTNNSNYQVVPPHIYIRLAGPG